MEHQLLRGQLEVLQGQLESRVQEALKQRNEHSTAVLQLQQDLHEAQAQVNH